MSDLIPMSPAVLGPILQPGPVSPAPSYAAGPTGFAIPPVVSQSSAAVDTHIADPRPHVAAESGRDFAAWFNAQITT